MRHLNGRCVVWIFALAMLLLPAVSHAVTLDEALVHFTADDYAETCAAIALVLFAHRLLQIEADGQYADVLERALYNGVLSGVSLDGRRFFYANHLTVYPQAGRQAAGHVAETRQEWFGCACCPPNVARLLASLSGYVYSTSPEGIYVHLYASSVATVDLEGVGSVTLRQETDYPWSGDITIHVEPATAARGGRDFAKRFVFVGGRRQLRMSRGNRRVGRRHFRVRGRLVRLWLGRLLFCRR